jgi:2,4-dienoyl-CoA reductase-like NADH-dependent reductase (Old Yellow Enzyme family)
MPEQSALFMPFQLGRLRLSNRFVMAPMTRSKSPHQVPGSDVATYYRRRAEGGVGLILTEGASPKHSSASGDSNVPAFFGDAALAGWRNVLSEVKSAGGKIIPQLWHQGTLRWEGTGPYPDEPTMSPSGYAKPGRKVTEPMTLEQINNVVAGFATSARYAWQMGFDGVEIHGAHGCLIDQFLWERTNFRQDVFGGSIASRARFAGEIIRAVRSVTAPDFPILFRFSQWKTQDYGARLAYTPQQLEELLEPLILAGTDMFHCSTRRFWEPEFPETGSDLNLAGWTKKLSGLPTITVGSVGLDNDFIVAHRDAAAGTETSHLEILTTMLERGDFDLVAVGRALIVDPSWPDKIRHSAFDELKPWSPSALLTLE